MKRAPLILQGVIQILVADPTGRLLQMSPEMLKDAPFHNFLVPGIIRFPVNGVGHILQYNGRFHHGALRTEGVS
jgi:hypothetical protein